MGNMSYCRHENTAGDLAEVWELWDESEKSESEKRGRKRIVELVKEMHEQFEFDGTYDEVSA